MPRKQLVKTLPLPPSIIFVDIDGLENHHSAESTLESPYGAFDMYGLDEFEYRAEQRALEEKNIARFHHQKHRQNWS